MLAIEWCYIICSILDGGKSHKELDVTGLTFKAAGKVKWFDLQFDSSQQLFTHVEIKHTIINRLEENE